MKTVISDYYFAAQDFLIMSGLNVCVFPCAFYLFIMHIQSECFHSHIYLSRACYYLQENPSHYLIQPSNHLLRLISCAFLNCKQNDLAYLAHCYC